MRASFLVAAAILVSGCAVTSLPRWEADLRQPVTDDAIMRINPGMSREQVLALIGPPLDVMAFPRRSETSWEYRFVDTWGYPSYLYVNFDPAGVVVSRLTRRIESNREGILR
jgi:outer membrane protein assembly factor BamE (lipoprotein component of BamABCDE complex)